MKNLLQFWRANHDIQPAIDPYAMIEYISSYVTKIQKGMSVIIEWALREAREGDMNLKESVRHIGNAFLNAIETFQQEAPCLVLEMPITRISHEVILIPTSHPDEWTYLLKDYDTLKKMEPESNEI